MWEIITLSGLLIISIVGIIISIKKDLDVLELFSFIFCIGTSVVTIVILIMWATLKNDERKFAEDYKIAQSYIESINEVDITFYESNAFDKINSVNNKIAEEKSKLGGHWNSYRSSEKIASYNYLEFKKK